MTYDNLLVEAESHGLIVKEKPLQANKGRIKGNKIAIKKDIDTLKEKACILAEEIGHYHTACTNITDQTKDFNRKLELKGRAWAYNNQIGLMGIVKAYKKYCKNLHEMAEYLNVTDDFLIDALEYYKGKYGLYTVVDNYIICFEPVLGVVEMFQRECSSKEFIINN